jgi:predicted amidohydrolase
MKDVRIAIVVSNSPVNKISSNLEGMVKWVKSSKNQGAAIVCFPEMNISGYSNHQDINLAAEPIPGPASRYLLNLAQCERIVILAGMLERDETGRVFASHLVIKPDGFVGIYRKLHISPPERIFLTPGNDIPLFHAEGVKFGIQLCYDAHFPELSTRMALKGADIIFIPHASPRGTSEEKYRSWMRHLPARAFDNSLFVIACNQTGENQKGLRFPGVAVIIGPSGKVIRKNLSGKEGVLLANLKAEDLNRVRGHRMRYFIPNRRPELYYTP